MLFLGSALAHPLLLLSDGMSLNDAAVRATQIAGLLFALAYLHYAVKLSWHSLGWRSRQGNGPVLFLQGFAAGVIILFLLITSLYLLGIHAFTPGRDYGIQAVGVLIIKALLTGLLVAVFEETLFRGALLGGLLQRTRSAYAAVVAVSLVYAAVHFMVYPPPAPGESVNWFSGPERFAGMIAGLFNPETLDAFLALFVLGILLGLMRLRDGNILRCIGVHAGLVAMIKVSRYFLAYEEGSRFDFLVSSHDQRLGYLALLWLGIATLVYYGSVPKRPAERNVHPNESSR